MSDAKQIAIEWHDGDLDGDLIHIVSSIVQSPSDFRNVDIFKKVGDGEETFLAHVDVRPIGNSSVRDIARTLYDLQERCRKLEAQNLILRRENWLLSIEQRPYDMDTDSPPWGRSEN